MIQIVMMRLLLVLAALCSASAWGQPTRREPNLGYVYPAGGQRGSVVQVTAGGQFLQGAHSVYVSGEGVRASVRRYVGRFYLDGDQRKELRRRMQELWRERQAEFSGSPAPVSRSPEAPAADLPDHPLVANLDAMDLRELAHVRHWFQNFRKRQQNFQIAETVLIEVEIEPGATPGDRELRLGTNIGLTNPICFQVGFLPEVNEKEFNDPHADFPLPDAPPVDLPVLLNGQILPGDIDRFRFRAREGQDLVIEAHARRLIPYLADAVPGWFQATMGLFDAQGNEVAFEDDFRFSPDPVLFYTIPRDGVYELEIRDAIHRGREDFVYRISVGETPFITEVFPLGGRTGTTASAAISGVNLTTTLLPLDTRPGLEPIRQAFLSRDELRSNPIAYAVGALPECNEIEPNDSAEEAHRVTLPLVVNGRISGPGDTDVFEFEGRAGEEVVAEVHARRLNSPLDSVLRLTDASGDVLEWNDDYVVKDGKLFKGPGLLTHHADSYLTARLPEDGVYRVHVADAQRHGGRPYAYRLTIAAPRPDFSLRVTPASLNAFAGGSVLMDVHALRSGGFEGDIELALTEAPEGFALSGARIPAGRNHVRMTLTAPPEPIDGPVLLRLEGRARIGGQRVSRRAVPAEDAMQAFLYRHLVPAQELLVSVQGRRRPPVRLIGSSPLRIPEGGVAQVRVSVPRSPRLREVQLELSEAPEGISLEGFTVVPGGLEFALKADGGVAQAGFADNLIVEVFVDVENQQPAGAARNRRRSLGVLPAISIEVVRPE